MDLTVLTDNKMVSKNIKTSQSLDLTHNTATVISADFFMYWLKWYFDASQGMRKFFKRF